MRGQHDHLGTGIGAEHKNVSMPGTYLRRGTSALKKALAVAIVPIVLLLAACGDSGGSSASNNAGGQTIQIEMRDIAFAPTEASVAKGEAVTFVFTNSGKVAHEAFVGDEQTQMDHEQAMMDGAMDHGGADVLTVDPGKSGTLTHTFDEVGTFEIGCHEPGHYDAGMKLTVTVA